MRFSRARRRTIDISLTSGGRSSPSARFEVVRSDRLLRDLQDARFEAGVAVQIDPGVGQAAALLLDRDGGRPDDGGGGIAGHEEDGAAHAGEADDRAGGVEFSEIVAGHRPAAGEQGEGGGRLGAVDGGDVAQGVLDVRGRVVEVLAPVGPGADAGQIGLRRCLLPPRWPRRLCGRIERRLPAARS